MSLNWRNKFFGGHLLVNIDVDFKTRHSITCRCLDVEMLRWRDDTALFRWLSTFSMTQHIFRRRHFLETIGCIIEVWIWISQILKTSIWRKIWYWADAPDLRVMNWCSDLQYDVRFTRYGFYKIRTFQRTICWLFGFARNLLKKICLMYFC